MPFYEKGAAKGGFEAGVRTALEAILASPYFIFRLEREPATRDAGRRRIASPTSTSRRGCRSSSGARRPTRSCSTLADAGQARRRRARSRSRRGACSPIRAPRRSATRFAAQWLRLQDVDKVHPDPNFYPELRRATSPTRCGARPSCSSTTWCSEDRSLLDLYRADYTFVNERLARHYGIPGVAGDEFRRVHVSGRHAPRPARPGQHAGADLARQPHLAGAARQVGDGSAARHAAAAAAAGRARRSTRPAEAKDGRMLTTRERMEMHRANPTCNSCHRFMDPIGLALDNFDVTGKWRMRENGMPLDTRGEFYDGTPVTSPAELTRGAAEAADAAGAHVHREPDGVRARPPRRVLRPADDPRDREGGAKRTTTRCRRSSWAS